MIDKEQIKIEWKRESVYYSKTMNWLSFGFAGNRKQVLNNDKNGI